MTYKTPLRTSRNGQLLGRPRNLERFDHTFLAGDIALVTQTASAILLASGCGAHDDSKCESVTTWNHLGFSHSTHFETASKRLHDANVVDFETCELWIPLADSFVRLAEGHDNLLVEQNRIREVALKYLETILGTLNQSAVKAIPSRSDWPTLRQFERFLWLVTRVAI